MNMRANGQSRAMIYLAQGTSQLKFERVVHICAQSLFSTKLSSVAKVGTL